MKKEIVIFILGILVFPILNSDNLYFDSGGDEEISFSEGIIFVAESGIPPFVINSYGITPPVIFNGSEVNLSISAEGMNSVWANVTLPNSTVHKIILGNNANVSFNDTYLAGRYNVTFYASNPNQGIISNDTYFMVGEEEIEIQFNVVDDDLEGVEVVLVILLPDTESVVHEHNFSGNLTDEHIDVVYDLFFEAYNESVGILLEDINLTENLNETIGIDVIEENVTEDFLITYGINATYNFTNATLIVDYSEVDYSYEEYLLLFKCDDWDFTEQFCYGAWVDVTGDAVLDLENNRFEYVTSSFSGFSIKQGIPPVIPEKEEEPKRRISGGGITQGEVEERTVEIVPSEMGFSLVFGESQIKQLKINNFLDRLVALSVNVEGELKDFISVENIVRVDSMQEKMFDVKIDSANKGLLTGRVIFSSGVFTQEIPIIVDVRSVDFLFDISNTIPEGYKRLVSGDKVLTQINLLQAGDLREKVDVTTNYVIKDFSGKVFLEESETFFVLDSKNFVKEFSTRGLPPGKYVLGMEVVYPGAFATSSAQFEIVKGVYDFKIILFVVLVVCVLIFVFYLLWVSRKKKGYLKKFWRDK